MNIYLLRQPVGSHGYDEAHGFVVTAANEEVARELASHQAGDEGPGIWTDLDKTTCTLLSSHAFGVPRVIIRDYYGD